MVRTLFWIFKNFNETLTIYAADATKVLKMIKFPLFYNNQIYILCCFSNKISNNASKPTYYIHM